MINTRLHVDDSDFTMDKGLFADGFKSEQYKKSGHPSEADFIEFARRIGVMKSRIDKLLKPFLEKQPYMEALVSRSFLSVPNKKGYLLMYNTKRNLLTAK